MLTIKQCPYTGPYASSATKHPNKGPTVQALKRMMVRLDLMSAPPGGMLELTNFWPAGGKFDQAFRKFQLKNYLPADGVYGEQVWKAVRYEKLPNGEHAMDSYGQKLIQDEWEAEHVPDEEDFRKEITAYCLAAEGNEDAWHYVQYRPFPVDVNPKASYIRADCSSYVVMAYHWAMEKSGLVVPDPSKQGWSGYGNTDYYEDDHPTVLSGQFRVGDLAHYPGHVTICRKAGTATSAIFSSHGQEAGPMPTTIYYRQDFRKVVRPPLKEGT